MISFISSWAQGIIVSSVIATIIILILPEGSSKKYIKVILGIYILFSIVSPIINKFSNKTLDVFSTLEYSFENKTKQVSSIDLEKSNSLNIKSMYEINLKSDIKNKIKSKGFVVDNVDVEISNDDKYSINKISIVISGEYNEEKNVDKKNVVTIIDNIEKVTIDLSKNKEIDKKDDSYCISGKDSNNLKEYISNIYDIDVKNIDIQ